MEKEQKYDPEDLESLMIHKSFEELYPEEKEFVLRHLDGPAEYESMRLTLIAVQEKLHKGKGIQPRPEIKSELLAKFNTQRSTPAWIIWLNGLLTFRMPELKWAIPVAIAAMVLFGWIFFFDTQSPTARLAERNESKEELKRPFVKEESPSQTENTAELPTAPSTEIVEAEEIEKELLEMDDSDFKAENIQWENESEEVIVDASAKAKDVVAEDNLGSSFNPPPVPNTLSSPTLTEELVRSESNYAFSDISLAESAIPTSAGNAIASNVTRKNASQDSDMFSVLFTAY